MDEKKIIDQIRESGENEPVPSSLSPVHIKRKLDEQREARKAKKWKKTVVRLAEAAAMLTLVATVGVQLRAGRLEDALQSRLSGKAPQEENAAPAETKTESEEAENLSEVREAKEQSEAKTQNRALAETKAESEEAENLFETREAKEQSEEKTQNRALAETLPEGLRIPESTQELYETLLEYRRKDMSWMARNGALVEEEIVMDSVAATPEFYGTGGKSQGVSGGGYSQTNLRELGVDEGDRVKTDGEYLYVIKRNSSIAIIRANGTALNQVSSVQPEDLNESVRAVYLAGDTLNVVTSGVKSSLEEMEKDVYETKSYSYVKLLTYDISDRSAPKLTGSAEQEGSYRSSRKVGDYVYLFTEFFPEIGESQDDSRIMPLMDGAEPEASDVYVPESIQNTEYLVIGAVNVRKPDRLAAHKAVVSGAENFYVTEQSIYIIHHRWDSQGAKEEILKFAYEKEEIRGVGSCEVDGSVNDSFSTDEYNGYLRVLTTDWDSENVNTLYVFDETMNLVGKIDDIAPGETIRSARFMGDIGYFVTFRQTDPLFTVDLSEPEKPRIVGELKVSGFSSYLHFYGEERMLGIGYDADEKTGITTGIKLSMFDISDPSRVTEKKRYVLKDANYCPGLSDYRAIMINAEKNLFGLVCDDNYYVFTFDEEKGFENLLTYQTTGGNDAGYWYGAENLRGLYIEDAFYLADQDAVYAFDMAKNFVLEEKLEF